MLVYPTSPGGPGEKAVWLHHSTRNGIRPAQKLLRPVRSRCEMLPPRSIEHPQRRTGPESLLCSLSQNFLVTPAGPDSRSNIKPSSLEASKPVPKLSAIQCVARRLARNIIPEAWILPSGPAVSANHRGSRRRPLESDFVGIVLRQAVALMTRLCLRSCHQQNSSPRDGTPSPQGV